MKKRSIQLHVILFIAVTSACSKADMAPSFTYPEGKKKALIMSYDDSPIEDIPLARLFDEYGITGTFNLNSGYLGTTQPWAQANGDTTFQEYIPIDSLQTVYKNHEIAAHASYHKNFLAITDEEILEEVESDVAKLQELTGRKITSMAYPFGNANPHIAQLVSTTGLTNARTVGDTDQFGLPDQYFLWEPTCHDTKALDLIEEYLGIEEDSMTVFYVWGHAWELRDPDRWEAVSQFCKRIANQDNIWYVGSGRFVEYQLALKKVIINTQKMVNPSDNQTVWVKIGSKVRKLKAGQSIDF
jgi:peptidoglycan/xylan/chitin deacetylase (PgdA/CDA1 family)